MKEFSLFLLAILFLILGRGVHSAEPGKFRHAHILPVKGVVDPLLSEYVRRQLEELREEKVDLLVLEIDSPGGVLDSMDEIIQALDDFPQATKVAYIRREALSAAAILSLACDKIIFSSEARFGDAGPIVLGPDGAFRHADAKIRSDLVARVRILADRHQRPGALAEAMVDRDSVVFQAIETDSGKRKFFTEAEWESFADQARWERGLMVHESRKDVFLEVTGARAVELGLGDGLASSEKEALKLVGFDGIPTRSDRSWVDTLVIILSSPVITILILAIGIIGLLIELGAPGIGLGGLTALLCFGLFFWSRFLGGTAGWLEVMLLLIGCVFLATEIFILPGFGVAGVLGLGLMAVSILMAMRHSLIPENVGDFRELGSQVLVLMATCILVITVGILLSNHLGKLPLVRKLTLAPDQNVTSNLGIRTAMDELVSADRGVGEISLGEIGHADSPLRPGGRARFSDSYLDVISEGEFIEAGTPIRIISRVGNRVVVRKV
jgi:membrane-bound serine protease (ClpP class)